MTGRSSAVVALTGAALSGIVVSGTAVGVAAWARPAVASPVPGPAAVERAEESALAVLSASVRASRGLAYRGTQFVASWHDGRTSSALVEVSHDPATGWHARTAAGGSAASSVPVVPGLDPRRLRLLAEHYALETAGTGTCAGRTATVVDARRPSTGGARPVVARFWVDSATGLLLRREVYDATGRTVHSAAFLDLAVRGALPPSAAAPVAQRAPVDLPSFAPRVLPHDLQLYEALERDHDGARVVHLAYSDGLSTLSVFAQPGSTDGAELDGFERRRVGSASAWVSTSSPVRVVWNGGGRVWTLVADAPADVVRDVVLALPQDAARERPGLLSRFAGRLGRGAARVASWVNPFG